MAAATAMLAACGGPKEAPPTLEMAQATAAHEARTELPLFLEQLKARPSDPSFTVTIQMPPEGSKPPAVLTMKNIVQTGSSFSGVIAKPDNNWPEFPAGATLSFPDSIIIDWSFTANRRPVGLFQTRARLCVASHDTAELNDEMRTQIKAETAQLGNLVDPKKACAPYDPQRDLDAK